MRSKHIMHKQDWTYPSVCVSGVPLDRFVAYTPKYNLKFGGNADGTEGASDCRFCGERGNEYLSEGEAFRA